MSVPRALLLVLALLQATGLAAVIQRETCEAACRDDGCGGDCTPSNDSPTCACHCPVTPGINAPAFAVVRLAPSANGTVLIFDRDERNHASPDPREILHVPRNAV